MKEIPGPDIFTESAKEPTEEAENNNTWEYLPDIVRDMAFQIISMNLMWHINLDLKPQE